MHVILQSNGLSPFVLSIVLFLDEQQGIRCVDARACTLLD